MVGQGIVRKESVWDFVCPAVLCIFAMGVFLIGFRYMGSVDTVPSELLPISVINEGNLDYNEFLHEGTELPYFFRMINGRVISFYPIMAGLLNVPVCLIAHVCGVVLIEHILFLSLLSSALIATFSVLGMYLCLVSVCASRQQACGFVFVYAFSTCVWSVVCRGLWQHGPALLFLTFALSFILKKDHTHIFWAGLFFGFAIFSRPVTAALVAPFVLFVYKYHRRYFFQWFIFLCLPVGLMLLYSQIYWGSIFALGQGQGLTGFSCNPFAGWLGLLFSPNRGLLIFSSFFVFAFLGMKHAFTGDNVPPVYRYMAVSVVLFFLVCSQWEMWWGGWSFGYRLLIELIPMLMLFAVLCWNVCLKESYRARFIMIGLVMVSMYIHFLGAFYFPSDFNYVPDNIDVNHNRLWDAKNGEIVRCTRNMVAAMKEKVRV